jgi:hypothetical protein
VGADPGLDGITAALADAVRQVADHERRAESANVQWSSDWNTSFDDELMVLVENFLGR